jgi:heptosyltransferase-2
VKLMRALDVRAPRRILVRATNWVGDAVMTLPALDALARACPQARLDVLAKPWVRAVYENAPGVASMITLDSEAHHAGPTGRVILATELREREHDWAVLFQNAFEAALIARLAGIPVRIGYTTDARRLLLTHPVPRTEAVKQVHETAYYLHLLHGAGLIAAPPPPEGVRPVLHLSAEDRQWATEFLEGLGLSNGAPLLGLAPGAAFGPAKCWPAERFAAAATELLAEGFAGVLLFGSAKEAAATAQVATALPGRRPGAARVVDLAGATGLGQAFALLERLGLFLTNDSGLMHAAAALGTPTLAVFGSTNPVTTAPQGPWVSLVRKPVDCGPCLKPECPTDLRCLTAIAPEEVAAAARELLRAKAKGEGA